MKIVVLWLGVLMATGMPARVHGASGEAIYKAKCSTCHDSGAGQAPRVTVRAEWSARETRGRNAMYESAIKGMPATAMAAKGGFTELSDAEVRLTVDYMLARMGFRDNAAVLQVTPAPAAPATAATKLQTSNAPVADPVLLQQIAEALRKAFSPGAQIESVDGKLLVRGVNIRVSVRDSVVTLEGTPEKPEVVGKAEQIAKSFRSVRRVDNRMVAAGMLDFD